MGGYAVYKTWKGDWFKGVFGEDPKITTPPNNTNTTTPPVVQYSTDTFTIDDVVKYAGENTRSKLSVDGNNIYYTFADTGYKYVVKKTSTGGYVLEHIKDGVAITKDLKTL